MLVKIDSDKVLDTFEELGCPEGSSIYISKDTGKVVAVDPDVCIPEDDYVFVGIKQD